MNNINNMNNINYWAPSLNNRQSKKKTKKKYLSNLFKNIKRKYFKSKASKNYNRKINKYIRHRTRINKKNLNYNSLEKNFGITLSDKNNEYYKKRKITPKTIKKLMRSYPDYNPKKNAVIKFADICNDTNFCLTYDYNRSNNIIKYFKEFSSKYIYKKKKLPPSLSGENGIITFITFKRNKYKVICIEKKNKTKQADNLFYEYYVGKYINKKSKYFPCFLKTYYIKYNNKYIFDKESESEFELEQFCKDSINFHETSNILLEYVPEPISFNSFLETKIKNYSDPYDILELLNILYQIAIVLDTLNKKDNYSHNDLHGNNILLTKIPNNKYVIMNYHYDNGNIVRIKTKYIVKFIDYGKNKFNTRDLSTEKYIKTLVKEIKNNNDSDNYIYIINDGTKYLKNGIVSSIGYTNFSKQISQIMNNNPSDFSENLDNILLYSNLINIGDLNYKEELKNKEDDNSIIKDIIDSINYILDNYTRDINPTEIIEKQIMNDNYNIVIQALLGEQNSQVLFSMDIHLDESKKLEINHISQY